MAACGPIICTIESTLWLNDGSDHPHDGDLVTRNTPCDLGFFKPFAAEYGYLRINTTLVNTAILFFLCIVWHSLGVMADRYGTRCSGVLAAIVMSVALMLLSTQECLIELYMFHLIFGAMANAI